MGDTVDSRWAESGIKWEEQDSIVAVKCVITFLNTILFHKGKSLIHKYQAK